MTNVKEFVAIKFDIHWLFLAVLHETMFMQNSRTRGKMFSFLRWQVQPRFTQCHQWQSISMQCSVKLQGFQFHFSSFSWQSVQRNWLTWWHMWNFSTPQDQLDIFSLRHFFSPWFYKSLWQECHVCDRFFWPQTQWQQLKQPVNDFQINFLFSLSSHILSPDVLALTSLHARQAMRFTSQQKKFNEEKKAFMRHWLGEKPTHQFWAEMVQLEQMSECLLVDWHIWTQELTALWLHFFCIAVKRACNNFLSHFACCNCSCDADVRNAIMACPLNDAWLKASSPDPSQFLFLSSTSTCHLTSTHFEQMASDSMTSRNLVQCTHSGSVQTMARKLIQIHLLNVNRLSSWLKISS